MMLVFSGAAQDQIMLSQEQKMEGIRWDRIAPESLESKSRVEAQLVSTARQDTESILTIDGPVDGSCAASDGSVELADGRTGILCATQYAIDIPISADFFFVLLDKQGLDDMLILMSLEPILTGIEVAPSREPDDFIPDVELDFCLFFCEGRWYISILNLTDSPQDYTLVGTITPIALGNTASHIGTIRRASPGTAALGLVDYTIEVPANAASLDIDLDTTTGGDIDLLVRFGERVTVDDGTLLVDFISQSLTGFESVTIDASSDPPLQAGTYFIAIGNFEPTRQNFSLTATITAGQESEPPTLSVTPNSQSFTAQEGGANPADQPLNINNVGDGDLNWTANASSTPSDWLSLSSTSGSAPSMINVSIDITGLAAGSYDGTISVSSSDVSNGPINIPVNLTVDAADSVAQSNLSANPTQLSFEAEPAGANPEAQSIEFANNAESIARWNASSDAPWLSLDNTSGNLLGGSTVGLNVSVDITDLAAGSHQGDITFVAEGFENLVVPVSLQIGQGGTEQGSQSGELTVLRFDIIEFEDPANWDVSTDAGCVIYTNNGIDSANVNVTLTDQSVRIFSVPAGKSVTVCGDIAHIDTRS
jgi:hypothetical protein